MPATRSAPCSTTRRPPTWTRRSPCRISTWDSLRSVRRTWRRLAANLDERYRFLIAKTHREFFSLEVDLPARPSSSFAARNFAPAEVSLDIPIANYLEGCGAAERLRSSPSGPVFLGCGGTDGRPACHSRIRGCLRNQSERNLGTCHRQEDCYVSDPYS